MQQGEEQGTSDQMTGQLPVPPRPAAGRRYRSLFWAIVLIGAGVMALLFNLDVIDPASLGMLTYVWPIIIIGVGVDLLLGRRSLLAGALVGVITVGLIIVLMVIGPSLGWTGDTELKTDTLTTPVSQATSVEVIIDTSGYSAEVHALPASSSPERPLFAAAVAYRGSIDFQAAGDTEKTVSLDSKGQRWWWFLLDLAEADVWDIGLDPGVPLDLVFDSSSGSVELDLSKLDLTALEASMSSGQMQVALPDRGGKAYEAALKVSSGDLEVGVAPGARVDLGVRMSSGDVRVVAGARSDVTVTFDGSSGEFTLELASDQAFRLEVKDISSGSVVRPPGLVQVTEGGRGEGVWETVGYSDAEKKVILVVEHMSSGQVTIDGLD